MKGRRSACRMKVKARRKAEGKRARKVWESQKRRMGQERKRQKDKSQKDKSQKGKTGQAGKSRKKAVHQKLE